jgi:autotransporter-associated beta strand protein
MKCKLISPAHERKTPHHTKIYRKAVAHSRGIEVLESRIAPATFFVSNANDSGTGSLRQAILDANSTPNSGGADLISFASIPTGTFVIQPTSELPAISEAVIIDGYTAPGTSQNTAAIGTDALLRVVLSGSLLNSGSGLTLGVAGGDPAATGGSTVRGLVINDFHPGINDSGNGILIHSNNNKVEGNFLGTTTSGNAALGNSNSGVAVSHFGGSDTYADNVIGGPALADRNLISGNSLGISLRAAAMNTLVIGNLIGTDKTGQFAIPNTNAGILIGGNGNVIGGATLGMGNVISGNVGPGISIGVSNNTTVIGNIMGLNAAGTAVVQNSGPGILMNNSATNITIGGSGTGEGNVISGNFEAGIEIGSSVGDGPANNVIVRGNKIGTDVSGTLKLGNQHGGIKVFGSTGTTIGGTSPLDGNVIAFNTNAAGISVREDAGPSSVAILGNSIFGNSRLGIDLGGGKENFFGVTENDNFDADQGPNGLTNLPTLTNLNNSGTDVGFNFSISAQPSTNYRIEFFALAPGQVDVSGSGQGAVFLGSQDVNTNAAGQFVGNFAQPIGLPANSYFTATITDTSAGQTSEFSPALGLPGGTYTWNGAQSSDWFNPLNWSPNGVPGAFDTAIYSGGTNAIQLNGDAGVLHFQHSAGAMTGFGTLYVRDTFTWTGGSQDGTNIGFYGTTATINGGGQPLVWNALSFIINDGTLTIGGAGLVFNTGLFAINPNGSLILNAGVFDQDGSGTSSNTYNAGKIEKLGTGAFGLETTTVQNAGSIESRAGSLKLEGYTGLSGSKLGLTGGNIQTSGTLTLDTDGELFGTGTITGDLANNGGYVYVGIGEVTGILNLTGGYTQTASGTLVVDLRGTTAGTNYDQFAVVGTASINGVLNVTILPGYTPALGHTLNVLTSSGLTGTFSAVVGEGAFATNYTTNNAQLVRNGLTYTWDAGGGGDTSWLNPLNWSPDGLPGASDAAMLNSNATITLDTTDVTVGDFIQNNGTLTGSKTLNIIGSFSWNGGTQTGTGMTHPVAESSTVLGGAAKTLDTRTLFVQGSGSSNNGSELTLNNGAKLQAGGLYEVLLATPFQSGGNGGVIEVRPEGTLRKSGATATTIPAGLTFTHNGLLEVLGGTFSVLSGGSATDAIFRVTPGNTLNFNSSSGFSLFNNVLFEGGGTVALIGGSLSNGSTTVLNVAANTTFAISGGTFVANTTTIVNNGPLQWSGGSLTGFGTWGVNGPFDISGNAVKTLSQLILNIAPTSAGSWSGSGNLSLLQNAQINVGGTVHVLSDLDVLDGDSSGSVLNVFPTGNFNKVSAGTTDMQIATTSDGFVTSSNGGTLQFSSTFTQNSGSLSVGGGSFIAATSPLQINAGLVTGTGTFTGSLINSGGIVSPGNGINSAGRLTITGDYSQGNDGELFIEAQGTTPGSGYDQLQVGGTTSLDRKLSFVTFNGYNAVAPTNFDVITSTGTISGTFPVTNLPPNGSVSYTANSVNVAFAPGDLVVDGTTGDDTLVLSVQSTVAGYTLNGGAFTPLGSVSGFIFNGGDGNDILIIDFANGNPIPATNGVNFDGQGESGGFDDKLMITGGAQGTVDYNLDNATSGSVVMSNFGTVNFTSLTPISNSGSATDVNFNLPNAANAATLGDDGTAGNTLSRLSGATFPQTDFANPTTSLTINSLSGSDTLTINELPDFNASLTAGSFNEVTLSGAITLAAGRNISLAASNVNATATGAVTVSGAGTISIFANNLDLAAGSTLSAAGTVSFATVSAGRAVDLGTNTEGKLSLTDAELDRVTAGTLQIGDSNSGAITVSSAITHANHLSLATGAGVSGAGALTLAAGKNLGVTANGAINLSGAITVPGTTTLAAGAANNITLTNSGNALATVSITSGSTVSLRDDGGFVLGAADISTLLSVQSAGAITQSGVLSGTGALTKLGTGTLTLSLVNTYGGGTTISNGTLQTIRTSSAGTGTITLGDGNTGANNVEFVLANNTVAEPVQSNPIVVSALGTGTATISDDFFSAGQLDYAGSLTLNRATTIREGTNNSTLFSGRISGNVGTLTLTGASGGTHGLFFGNASNDFAGNVVITGGANALIFGVSVAGSIPDTASVTVDGTFLLGGVNETINALNGSGVVQNGTGANTLTVGGNGGTGTFSGAISNGSGALTLIKSGAGTQTLTGANSYTGATTVSAGTLQIGNGGTTGSLSTSGTVSNNGTLTFNRSNTITQGTNFASVISGTGAVVQAGSGTLVFSGVNTYTGVTNVNAGTLIVGGSLANGPATTDVTVASGAILAGIGTIGGTVSNSGTVQPGDLGVAGELTISGNYTQTSGGILAVDLGGTIAGELYDVLSVGGTATLAGTLDIANVSGFTPANGNTFRVVQSAGNPGTFTTLTGDTAGLSQAADGTGLVLTSSALTYVWDNSAGNGDWFNALNWDLDSGVPGASDIAILNIASTINLTTGVSVGTFTQTTGTVTGVGNMTIGTSFTWSGGTQSGAATLIIGTGATATLSGSGTKTLDSRFIQNDGTLTITGSGALSLLNGPTITNNGIWDYQSDADLRQDDTTNALFKNTGGATLRKTTGAGAAATVIGLGNPNLAFENDGAIEVMAGTLTVFSSGGVWEGSPTVAISASATVGFTGGNFTWNAAPALSGGGTLDVGGAANVTLAGGTLLTVPTGFTLSKSGTGVLTGDGNMMVDGVFTFAGGTHSGTGTTTIAVGGTWNLTSNTGNMFLDGRTVNLNGTANYTGSATAFLENGTTIDNAGTFIISGDGDLGTGAGTSAFNNLTGAILRKTGGTGDTDIGSASGGTAVNFTNGGTVESQAGRLFFNDTYSQHAGEMILSGGAFATGSTLIFAGGELLGAGTITGNVNNTGATVRPGGTGAAGTLTITGAYTQGTGGMLAAELGGTGGGQFDVLSAGTGTTLDGTLNIANISGFTPANANTFRVVQSAGNPGTFAALTGDTTNISQSADATGLLLTAAVAAGDETDVSLSGGDLIVTDINGGTSNDMLTVVINGTNLRVSDPGNQLVAGLGATQVNANTVDVPLASITGNIQFNTLAGDDTLTVDFSGGNFSNQIEFIGGANTATGDKLSLTGGGTFALALFSYTNANDGFVEITGNFTIIYTGIEPISSTITAAAMELDYFPAAAGTITVSDSGVAGRTLVSSTLGAATTFVNPSGSLDISTGPGAGNHAINVQGVGSSFGADLTIEGQTGTETVNFQTNATTIGGLLTVLSENVNFNAAVTSAGLTTSATAILVSATLNHGAVNATFSSAATLTGNGAITNTGGALRLTGSGFTANFSGTIGDLELAMTDTATLALTQSLNVSDSLLIQTVDFITASSTSEAILVSGNVTSTDTTGYANINSTITLTGTGTSSFSGPGAGLQGNLSINKTGSSGIAQFATDETFAAVGVVRGILDLSGRTITSTFIVGGGTLSGTGTINGNVNVIAGTVSPGGTGTAGTITISGDYTQGAGGTLAAELGGVSAVQYDALDIGGTAALAGILSVTNSPSFIPADGSFFTLVTASSVTGGFNTISASGYTPDQSATAFAVVAGESTVVAPKDPFTFSDQNGDIVKVTLTGKGSVNVVLQGGVSDNADIASIELIGTDLTSKLNVVITSKPQFDASFGTDIGRIFTSGALQHVGSITLGSNINLGDGVRDATPDLRVTGKMNALVLGNLSQGAYIKLGEGLPYNVPNESKTPDTYNNRPSLTVGHVLGAGVNIEVLGDGTPEGVGGGGFSKVVFKSWAFNGHLRTTQGIGSFVVKTGDFYGILEVDKFSNGEQNTASVGSMSIAQGAWGSSGSEIEGNVGSFDAAAFLAGASITAGSIGSVKTTGALAGTFILTDPDAAAVPTFTVNSDFTGRVVSAVSIKKLKIKGDFTGSLEAPSIGSITAFAFLGTAGVTDITTTAGKLGLLTSTAGIVRDYTIVSDAAFSGIKVKLGKLSSSTVGIDNVHVTATSIGAINVDLSTAKGSTGVDLTGIRNSSFTTTATGIVKGTTGSIGKVTVKLKGGTDGDGTGIINTTFDARVLAGEFGMGLLASTVNSLGNVSVNLSGFGGSSIGLDDAAFEGDMLGTTTVAVTRGKGASTARGVDGTTFTATGAIGALSFSGDVTANMVTDTEVLAGGKIAGLKVAAKTSAFGSLVDSAIAAGQSLAVSGTDKQQKAALTAASLGVVSISGSLTSSKIVAGANIGAVTVGASATDSLILAGAKLGGDFTVGDGNESYQRAAAVTSVTVGGAFTRSSIVAGIASTNATFGDADDALAAVAGTLAQSSSIGALKFGTGSGTNAAAPAIPHSFAIQAAAIKSLANAGSAAVSSFADALFLDLGTAGEDATDVLVRLRA